VLDKEAVYASSEFTTGKLVYDLCVEFKVVTREKLKEAIGSEYQTRLLNPNKEKGIRFARKLRELGHMIVLTPNPLVVPGWGQPEYLQYWREIIQKKCHSVYFNEGWEFSNGCTYEYSVALDAELGRFDHNGKQLTPSTAKALIGAAIENLQSKGFEVPDLRKVYERLGSS